MYFACKNNMNLGGPEGRMLQAEFCPSKIRMLKPLAFNMIIFGDKAFKEVTKVK